MRMEDVTEDDRTTNRSIEADDLRLRQSIAAHISMAATQGFFCLRRRVVPVLRNHEWGPSQLFLTTNWDRLLETDLAMTPKSVVHIHGDIATPSGVYLPTETSTEMYRPDEANDHIGQLTGTAVRILQGARRICIYGLSLSPLDAEVNVILGVGLEPRATPLPPVYVYNIKSDLDATVWRLRAALHPGAVVDIRPVAVEAEVAPPIPHDWYLQR